MHGAGQAMAGQALPVAGQAVDARLPRAPPISDEAERGGAPPVEADGAEALPAEAASGERSNPQTTHADCAQADAADQLAEQLTQALDGLGGCRIAPRGDVDQRTVPPQSQPRALPRAPSQPQPVSRPPQPQRSEWPPQAPRARALTEPPAHSRPPPAQGLQHPSRPFQCGCGRAFGARGGLLAHQRDSTKCASSRMAGDDVGRQAAMPPPALPANPPTRTRASCPQLSSAARTNGATRAEPLQPPPSQPPPSQLPPPASAQPQLRAPRPQTASESSIPRSILEPSLPRSTWTATEPPLRVPPPTVEASAILQPQTASESWWASELGLRARLQLAAVLQPVLREGGRGLGERGSHGKERHENCPPNGQGGAPGEEPNPSCPSKDQGLTPGESCKQNRARTEQRETELETGRPLRPSSSDLPVHWVVEWSEKRGRWYYFHTRAKTSQWHQPQVER